MQVVHKKFFVWFHLLLNDPAGGQSSRRLQRSKAQAPRSRISGEFLVCQNPAARIIEYSSNHRLTPEDLQDVFEFSSGKHTEIYGKSPVLVGNFTINGHFQQQSVPNYHRLPHRCGVSPRTSLHLRIWWKDMAARSTARLPLVHLPCQCLGNAVFVVFFGVVSSRKMWLFFKTYGLQPALSL